MVNGDNESGRDLKKRLHEVLGSRVVEARSLPVGFGLTGVEVNLADGRHLAVKARERGAHARIGLEIEAFMLGELAKPVRAARARRALFGLRSSRHGFHRQ